MGTKSKRQRHSTRCCRWTQKAWKRTGNWAIFSITGEHQLKALGLQRPRILEVGCGKGVVIAYLMERGYPSWGVELAKVAPVESVKEFVFTGISALDLPAGQRESFNALFLLDIIEH